MQALVHRSQLYISGQQAKVYFIVDHTCAIYLTGSQSALQGFHDPAPHFPKVLSVEYTFRGHSHHAEIRDSLPVVLPLEGK